MATVVKINSRNDVHLPKEVLRAVNLSEDRFVCVETKGNAIVLIPVDIEPRYSQDVLEGMERLFQREKDKAVEVKSEEDIRALFKKSSAK